MKAIRALGLVLMLALVVTGLAFAQGAGNARRGQRGPDGFGRMGGPAGIELRQLNLTDAQRQQIRDIVQRYQEQMRTEIMSVLTPEQQEKAKQLQAQREARLKDRLNRLQQRQQ